MPIFGLFGPPDVEKLSSKGDIKGLINALQYRKDADIQIAAIKALGKIQTTETVRSLFPILNDENPQVRLAVVEELSKVKQFYIRGEVVEPLIATLNDKDTTVRLAVIEALEPVIDERTISPDWRAVEPLITTLNDENPQVRLAVVETLLKYERGRMFKREDGGIVEALIAALNDKDATVRLAIGDALGIIGDERAIDPLIATLNDPDATVREGTVKVLTQIGDGRIVEPFITLLNGQNTIIIRKLVIEGLGRIGDERAVEPLIAILNDQDATVRECAIKVLNQIRDERAVEPLIAVSNDQDAKTDSIESTETITMRANSYFRSKEYIKAIQTYREALLQTPDVKTYWNNMGYIFNSFVETNFRNNIAGVSVNYNDLLVILSNSDLISSATRSLWFQLIDKVHCDGLKQCLDESERCWLRVLDINPGDFDCSIFLAHLYEDLGFREKAKVILENATPITTQERETLKSEWEYFNELGTKNLDADLRPKPYTTAASPIHKMYGDTLRSILEEIKKNRTLLHGE